MNDDTLAIRAHKSSIKNASAGNKEAWVGLFAEDATAYDPVGSSPHDPEGKGFHGREGISHFWDIMIGTGNLNIVSHKRIPCGEKIAACTVTACNEIADMKTHIEMIVVYEVNDAGKIQTLKAYWDLDALNGQLADLA